MPWPKSLKFLIKYLLICGLVLGVFYSRFFGLNWDQNTHLHPDERFLTMVTGAMTWPKSWTEYFTSNKSPLNPANLGFDFYVYGTWPLILTKFIAQQIQLDDYNGIALVGRAVSASTDFLTFMLVILIAAKLAAPKHRLMSGLAAGLIYGLFVTAIQQAHFFTTDPFLVLALTASFHFGIQKQNLVTASLVGVFLGLAVAAKISGVLFGPIIGLLLISNWLNKKNSFKKTFWLACLTGLVTLISVRVFFPILFQSQGFIPTGLDAQILNSWKALKSYDGINTPFPPGIQWIPMMNSPYLITQFSVWGIGLPLCLLIILLVSTGSVRRLKLTWYHPIVIIFIWIFGLTLYQSLQFAKTLRYLFPIAPFLAILAGFYLAEFSQFKFWKKLLVSGLMLLSFWWTASFFKIYQTPHTRVAASNWIYANVPIGSTLTYEYWDDGLPLSLGENTGLNHQYQVLELPLYDADSLAKWSKLSKKLAQADYIVLSSNRLWRSISALPNRYPSTSRYYQQLFDGSLGFSPLAQFANYPCLIPGNAQSKLPSLKPSLIELTRTPNCLLAFGNAGAEEAFTVYDHPTVMIFKNTQRFSSDKILRLVRNLSL